MVITSARFFLFTFLASLAFAEAGISQQTASEGVESLRRALQLPDSKDSRREKAIQEALGKLNTPVEIWAAASLGDWREFYPDGRKALADQQARQALVKKFQAVFEKGTAPGPGEERDTLLELAMLIAKEEASSGGTRPFSLAMAQVLAVQAFQGEVNNRVAPIRALGLVNPETEMGMAAFTRLMSDKEMRIRRAALDGLSYWVEAIGPTPNAIEQGTISQKRNQVRLCCQSLELASAAAVDANYEVRRRAAGHFRLASVILNSAISDPTGKTPLGGNDPRLQEYLIDRGLAEKLAKVIEKGRKNLAALLPAEDLDTRLLAHLAIEDLALARKAWKSQAVAHGLTASEFPVQLKESVGDLAKSLGDENYRVRRSAVDTLELLGPDAAGTVRELVQALEDQDRFVRWSAIRALVEIGGEATKAVPKLRLLLKDQDGDVRKAAAQALAKLEGK